MTTHYQAVLPSIYPLWTERCLASCKLEHVLVVDNTHRNRGVSASWNLGIDALYERNSQWLVVMSAALRFGEPGGVDFLEHLTDDPNLVAIEAARGIGWHLIAFPRAVIDKVGKFDENFYPAYFEDLDYSRRIFLSFPPTIPYWEKVDVDVAIAGFAHGVDLAGVRVSHEALRSYFLAKWGGPFGGNEIFPYPFNDPTREISWWPKPRHSR